MEETLILSGTSINIVTIVTTAPSIVKPDPLCAKRVCKNATFFHKQKCQTKKEFTQRAKGRLSVQVYYSKFKLMKIAPDSVLDTKYS